LFGFGAEVGFPIQLVTGSNTYLVPQFGWHHTTYKYGDNKEKNSQVTLGLNFQSYLFDKEIKCDSKQGHSLSKNWYKAGSSYIGYYTRGSLDIGSTKTEDIQLPNGYKENFTNTDLKLNYVYYPIDYFGVGAGISFMNQVQKSDNNSNNSKTSYSAFSFMPQIVGHIPAENCFRNMFLQAEGCFGSQKYEYAFSSSSSEKYSLSGYGVYLGYNAAFAEHLAFTTMAGYKSRTTKNKDSDDKYKERGISIRSGIRFFF
jgi:hypothetical protein